MEKRNWKHIIPYMGVFVLPIAFCIILSISFGVFGTQIDWFSQHSVIPDYFRQQFYETGDLFQEFALNLGGGQNIYYFSYYGLYSPVLLLSYALPFVSMGNYLMAVSIVSIGCSAVFLYHWLVKRGIAITISFMTACMFSVAAPMLLHSYYQVMFVNYMPFLCLALLGVDRYFEKKKWGVYLWSCFLLIMTSFYFSVAGFAVLVLYGSYRYFQLSEEQGRKPTVVEFLKEDILFCIPMGLAVLLSGILLVPTVFALAGGRNREGFEGVAKLLLPSFEMKNLLYYSYGVGLSSLALVVLLAEIFRKRNRERILIWGCIAALLLPVVVWLLNGGLYIHKKVLIPFLPIVCYLIACYVQRAKEKRESYIFYWIALAILLLTGYWGDSSDGSSFRQQVAVGEAMVLVLSFGICNLLRKKSAGLAKRILPFALLLPGIFGLLLVDVVSYRESSLDKEVYAQVTDEGIGEEIEAVLDKETGCYRLEQSESLKKNEANMNRIWSIKQYISSMYASSYNETYLTFRKEIFQLDMQFRNILMQSASENPVWRRLMGVKYVASSEEVAGYELCYEGESVNLYKNTQALPMAYVTKQVMEEETYKALTFPYNQTTLLSQTVVEESLFNQLEEEQEDLENTVVEEQTIIKQEENWDLANLTIASKGETKEGEEDFLTIEELQDGYHIHTSYHFSVKVPVDTSMGEGQEADTLFLQFQVKNNLSGEDISIWAGGQRNKLTSVNSNYYNENTTFTWSISLKENQQKLTIKFGEGDYEISGIQIFVGTLPDKENLVQEELEIDWEQTKGNQIVGQIVSESDGVLVTSIPYDDGFQVLVDGKETELQKVNTAFLGVLLEAGEHEVKIVYHAKGAGLGKAISIAGILLFMLYFVFCKKNNRKRQTDVIR